MQSLELILSRAFTPDRIILEQVLRKEAGKARMSFRMVRPEGDRQLDAPGLATAIRVAAGRAAAIVVEPIPRAEVRKAMEEARSRGATVVAIDPPSPPPGPDDWEPVVTITGFAESARKLLAAAVEDASLFALPKFRRVLVLQDRLQDPYSSRRSGALSEAVKAAGLDQETLVVDEDDVKARATLLERLKRGPAVSVILTEWSHGLSAAVGLRRDVKKLGLADYMIAGYAPYDVRMEPNVSPWISGIANQDVQGHGSRVFQLVGDSLAGRAGRGRVELAIDFIRTAPAFYPVRAGAGDARTSGGGQSGKPATSGKP